MFLGISAEFAIFEILDFAEYSVMSLMFSNRLLVSLVLL